MKDNVVVQDGKVAGEVLLAEDEFRFFLRRFTRYFSYLSKFTDKLVVELNKKDLGYEGRVEICADVKYIDVIKLFWKRFRKDFESKLEAGGDE